MRDFDSVARDAAYWQTVASIVADRGYTLPELLKHWPSYVLRRDLVRFLAHYELFKETLDLPGHFIDLGVFRGSSLFTWSNLLEMFSPFDRHRLVFGFDGFEGLTDFQPQDEGGRSADKHVGAYKSCEQELLALTAVHNADAMIPAAERVRLIVGNVRETLPRFVANNPGLRVSLLYLDVDLYLPTKIALDLLYPLVIKGGIIAFDEYAQLEWPGESQAVDEFFATLPERPRIRKFPFAHKPCFIVK